MMREAGRVQLPAATFLDNHKDNPADKEKGKEWKEATIFLFL